MESCLFCEIIARTRPAHIIQETEACIAFLDLFPTQPGHVLIVPKQHMDTFLHAPTDLFIDWLTLAQQVAQRCMVNLGAAGINLIQNNGEAAGQVIPHLHLHVIPRYEQDGLKAWPGTRATEEALQEMERRLRQEGAK